MDNVNFDSNELLIEFNKLNAEFENIIKCSKTTLVNSDKNDNLKDMLDILCTLIRYNDKKQIFDEKIRAMNELNMYEVIWN